MKNDYKDVLSDWSPPRRRLRRRWFVIAGLLSGLSLALSLPASIEESSPEPDAPISVIPLLLPERPAESQAVAAAIDENVPAQAKPQIAHHPSHEVEPHTAPEVTSTEISESATPEAAVTEIAATEIAVSDTEIAAPLPAPQIGNAESRRHEIRIKRGDTLSAIFDRLNIEQRQLYQLLSQKQAKQRLSRLQPGQVLEFLLHPVTGLESLRYRIDAVETLEFKRQDQGFDSTLVREQLDRRIGIATGAISSSLFVAGQEAGLTDNVIMQLVHVLGWDIDFALDIREGDAFTVVYDELFSQQGEKVRDGKILAVEFVNRGRKIRALRYENPEGEVGYYSPDGNSMRKAFLRTPVKFSRITSGFSKRRWHPVLHRFRAHKGVDYAAPIGTPVRATGSGKTSFVGRKGGYGKTVVLQHGGKYTTLYAHLSRFARGLRSGQRVRQGQVIGYVGQSGLASGPHLHYEFRVRGQHRDPLRTRLPKAMPLPATYQDDFTAQTRPLIVQLDLLRRAHLARGGDASSTPTNGPS